MGQMRRSVAVGVAAAAAISAGATFALPAATAAGAVPAASGRVDVADGHAPLAADGPAGRGSVLVRSVSKRAAAQGVTYETVFTGSYSFGTAGSSSAYGTTSQLKSSAAFGFTTVTDDQIKQTAPDRITEYTSTRVQGAGSYHLESVSTGSPTTSQDCTFGGQGKRTSKPFVQAPSPQQNPLLTYAWELPDATGHGLKSSCGSGIFLPATPTGAFPLTAPSLDLNDQAFDEAFTGSGSARYKQLPVSRPIDGTITATDPVLDAAGDTIGSISSHATVSATVRFLRFGPARKKGKKPPKVTKVGQLLLESTLETLGIAAGGSSPIADGDPTTVLVPTAAPGTVTLSVTGGVVSHSDIATQARIAHPAAPLFSGSGRVRSALGGMIALRPSTAAHAALGAPHAAVPITMRATFTPAGGGARVSATLAGTIAATG